MVNIGSNFGVDFGSKSAGSVKFGLFQAESGPDPIKFVRNWWISGQLWSNVVNTWQMIPGQIRPNLAEMGPIMCEFDPMLVDSGQKLPDIGLNLAGIDEVVATV